MSGGLRRLGAAALMATLACGHRLTLPVHGAPRAASLSEEGGARIPGGRFQVIALVSSNSRSPRRLSHDVAEQLRGAGVTTPRVAGRWSSQSGAVKELCSAAAPTAVDGVLFVTSHVLRLRDCVTGETAYAVSHARGDGTALTKHLLEYLRRPDPAPSAGRGAEASAGGRARDSVPRR